MTPPSTDDTRWITPTGTAVAEAVGTALATEDIQILLRDERFLAILPDGRHGWFPQSAVGADLLEREARVLDLLAAHCRFPAPTVLARTPRWQLRRPVPGTVDPWGTYHRILADPGFAEALGTSLGLVLADQHCNVPSAELAGWLPDRPAWPEPHEHIAAALGEVISDAGLVDAALAAVTAYEQGLTDIEHPVLVHGDLGVHNITLTADGMLGGVFDYADASLSDRHRDFCYFLFDTADDRLLAAAIAAYRDAGGAPIEVARVALGNAACAAGFLAFRQGHPPDARPAGRTLAEDLAWVRLALSRLG